MKEGAVVFREVTESNELNSPNTPSVLDPSPTGSLASLNFSLREAATRAHYSSNPNIGRSVNLLAPEADSEFPIEDLKRRLTYGSGQIDMTITGAALDHIVGNYEIPFVNWLVGRTRVFARARPSHKTWIVERLIAQGRFVGMCGDGELNPYIVGNKSGFKKSMQLGTNDCGALKAAHVGIALSDAEASIVSPFTSTRKSVADVVTLIKEGRCALETSFTAFKYMVLYPVIQLLMTASMYTLGTGMRIFLPPRAF